MAWLAIVLVVLSFAASLGNSPAKFVLDLCHALSHAG